MRRCATCCQAKQAAGFLTRSSLRYLLAVVTIVDASTRQVLKGISYSPVPCTDRCWLGQDDFMSESKPMWGSRYRGDLHVIKALGANHIRLYGNNPANDHREFLDAAHRIGLRVIVGMSDWPFVQSPNNCWNSDFDCYSQGKEAYLANLNKGFLLEDGQYHPAIAQVVAINEADLKLPSLRQPKQFCKSIISAIDGMLDAERLAHATGAKVNFTATFSFGICWACGDYNKLPSLGQMQELRIAFLNPLAYGYQPRNNLAQFYYFRFMNSFNTANSAGDVQSLFLSTYEKAFPAVPVVIQEYHSPHVPDQQQDLHDILNLSRHSSVLLGISFFEYQVRYDKGGSELNFGLFGLGDYSFANFSYFGNNVSNSCLVPRDATAVKSLASVLAEEFHGVGIDESTLCMPDPAKVTLDQAGYDLIADQRNLQRMGTFVRRVVQHLGGDVVNETGFLDYVHDNSSKHFDTLVAAIRKEEPAWAACDADAACFVDREALMSQVRSAVDSVCDTGFNCTDIPPECSGDLWSTADYVFSMSFNQTGASPFAACYFGGAAVFGNAMLQEEHNSKCVVSPNPAYTALIEDGYQVILSQASPDQTAIFIARVVAESLGGGIVDRSALLEFAAHPPASLPQLKAQLKEEAWLCGIEGHGLCPTSTTTTTLTTTPFTEPTTTTSTTSTVTTSVMNHLDQPGELLSPLVHPVVPAANGGGSGSTGNNVQTGILLIILLGTLLVGVLVSVLTVTRRRSLQQSELTEDVGVAHDVVMHASV